MDASQKMPGERYYDGLGNLESSYSEQDHLQGMLFGETDVVSLGIAGTKTYTIGGDYSFMREVLVTKVAGGLNEVAVAGTDYSIKWALDWKSFLFTNESGGALVFNLRISA